MKTVIEMARDQGLPETEVAGVFIVNQDDLGRFAELVRADEREACAKVCDDLAPPCGYNLTEISFWDVTSLECAAAIRARSQA